MRQANARRDAASSGANIDRVLTVCTVRFSGTLSCAAGAFVPVPFNFEDSDLDSMHDLIVNPDRITLNTIPADATGVQLTGWCIWDAGSGLRELALLVDGGGFGPLTSSIARAYEVEQTVHVSSRIALPAGRYFGLAGFSQFLTNLLEARLEFKYTFL